MAIHGPFDVETFARLAEQHGRELRLHCYRMLGSIEDAEDAAQEALARGWRGREGFEGRASPRTWLYRIATNLCLRVLERRAIERRLLPQALGPNVGFAPLTEADRATPWLEPLPDAWLADTRDASPGPEARLESLDAVRLAFIVAIHELPPRQRAVLLLRDVVGLTAAEAAGVMAVSEAAANSSLQRARARLRASFPYGPPRGPVALDAGERALLDRYVETWEAGDIHGFVALLARDAAWAMPPWREWYAGPEAISAFLSWAWRRPGQGRRLIPTSANGQPAFGYYRQREGGTSYEPFAIQVVEITPIEVHTITNFVDARLFPLLGLPSSLPSNER